MHCPPWFWYCVVVLVSWGVVGLLQKLSTNHLSAESALVWLVVGYFLMDPFLYPHESILAYSVRSLAWAFLSALLNTVGAWALLAAMKHGGKAALVVPMTALYPVVTVFVAPVVLHESITLLQTAGVVCALIAVAFLST